MEYINVFALVLISSFIRLSIHFHEEVNLSWLEVPSNIIWSIFSGKSLYSFMDINPWLTSFSSSFMSPRAFSSNPISLSWSLIILSSSFLKYFDRSFFSATSSLNESRYWSSNSSVSWISLVFGKLLFVEWFSKQNATQLSSSSKRRKLLMKMYSTPFTTKTRRESYRPIRSRSPSNMSCRSKDPLSCLNPRIMDNGLHVTWKVSCCELSCCWCQEQG